MKKIKIGMLIATLVFEIGDTIFTYLKEEKQAQLMDKEINKVLDQREKERA